MDRPAPSLLPIPSWASATQDPPRREPGEPGTPAISGREEQTKPWCSTKSKLTKCRISFWWNLSSNLFRGTLTIPWGSLLWPCPEDHSALGTLCFRASLQDLSAPGPLRSRASLHCPFSLWQPPPVPAPPRSLWQSEHSLCLHYWLMRSQELLAVHQAANHFESNSFELRHGLMMGNQGLQKWVHRGRQCQDRSFPGFLCESKSKGHRSWRKSTKSLQS